MNFIHDNTYTLPYDFYHNYTFLTYLTLILETDDAVDNYYHPVN